MDGDCPHVGAGRGVPMPIPLLLCMFTFVCKERPCVTDLMVNGILSFWLVVFFCVCVNPVGYESDKLRGTL